MLNKRKINVKYLGQP